MIKLQLNKRFKFFLVSAFLFSAINFFLFPANAAETIPKRYAHLMLGNQPLDNAWSLRDEGGNQYLANIEALRWLGFALQTPRKQGSLQYGFEGAGFIGYDSNRKLFVRIGGEASEIDIDSELWTGSFSAGAFVSVKPAHWLRIFAATGPNIYWGRLSGDSEATAVNSSSGSVASGAIVIDTRTDNYAIGLAVYARAGIDFIFPNGFILGASLGQHNGKLNFGSTGRIDLNQPQYLLTLGSYF